MRTLTLLAVASLALAGVAMLPSASATDHCELLVDIPSTAGFSGRVWVCDDGNVYCGGTTPRGQYRCQTYA